MSKKKKAEPEPRYVPPLCTACSAYPGKPRRLKVYSGPVRTGEYVVRYCKCPRCDNTRAVYERAES